ncbi:retroviral aspartyl protease family protein [Rhizophagus irregularis DAOM 181602=DAOM 197198]|nr:retroviral aspartyl protease family protein [Rhizophagus irregularis DAOM 181602=DAOM 197198]
MADEAAITNALQTVFGNNAANLLSRGSNIAKIEPFSGKEDEDPIEWLAIFEKAAATNGWTTPERKLAVAASYLRGAASDWYDTNSATIGNHWESGQNTGNNFTDLFKKYFANDTRKNKWYQELLTLRQGSNETVDDYAAKFQRLLKRVDTTNAIPDAQKIRMFLFGLTPTITPMVHLQDANTLSDVIGNARKVETGLNYAHLGPSVTGIATKVATVSTTPAKTESSQMEAIEALTQQMQKLSLNYANLSSALLAQTQPIQPQPVRRIQPARYTQPNNLTQTFRPNRPRTDIRDIECYRCGEKGHYARDCMSERNARRPQRRDAYYLETYEETYDSYDNYYKDEYYQDYYDNNYEEAEAYVTTRSRSQPTTNYRPKPKQPRAVENIISSESQQEQRLRRPQPRQNINIPMDEVIETTATPAVPLKRTVKRTPRMPSIIEQMPPYRISDDILNMPSSAKIGQLLKYNDQKKDFARILRRPPKTQKTNYVDRISDSEEGDTRDTTAVKCAVRIKGDPVYAILDSGAAVCVITKSLARKLRLEITKPSNTIVVTADGTRNRALGQIEKVPIVIQTLLIPTTFHVIDSKDETLLLGTDWFRRTRAVLDFNNKSVQLTFLAKTILALISIHIGEVPGYVSFQEEEIDNEIDEIFDEYEYEDDLIEKEIHLLNSESSEDEEIWEQWYQQPLNYNPWDEKEEIPDQYNLLEDILNDYLTEDDEDKTDNPALFLAQAEKGNEWNIQKDLHTFEQHLDNITQVFQALRNANLKIKLKKCYFCLPSIAFLGHIVGRDGIKVDPSKIEKIRNFPAPTSVTEIRSHYLGLLHFSVVTDHSALKWLQTSKIPTGRRARWIMQLQQYDFTIQHRAGKANANADALSRINPTEEPINSAECFLAIIGEEKNIYEVQNDGYSRPQRIPKKFNIIQPEFKPEYLINEPFWEHSQRKYRFNFFSHLY